MNRTIDGLKYKLVLKNEDTIYDSVVQVVDIRDANNNFINERCYDYSISPIAPAFDIISIYNVFGLNFSFLDSPYNIDQFCNLIIAIEKPYFQDLPKFVARYNRYHKKKKIDVDWFNSSTYKMEKPDYI